MMKPLFLGLGVFLGVVITLKLIWTKEPAAPSSTPCYSGAYSGTYTECDGTQWSWAAS